MQIELRKGDSLVAAVARRLREFIEANHLGAGDRLPTEARLLEEFSVSRSVLREAVSRLAITGLITVRRGHGMFVSNPDALTNCVKLVRSAMAICPRDLKQFIEFRVALECWAARRAAEIATPSDVEALASIFEQIDREGQSYEEGMRADFAFHRKLFEISGNQLLVALVDLLQQWTITGMLQSMPKPRDHKSSRRLHSAIVKGVANADPDAAENAMRTHMRFVQKRISEATDRSAQAG
jgi:DNA-binding FadR family transcriptional regulator